MSYEETDVDASTNINEINLDDYEALVWSLANKFKYIQFEVNDLFQSGYIGLIKAKGNFSFEFGTKFTTFAVPYIVGEMKQFMRSQNSVKVSKGLLKISRDIDAASKYLEMKNEKKPSLGEIADYLKISKEDCVLALEFNNNSLSINKEYTGNEGSNTFENLLSNENDTISLDNINLKIELLNLSKDERIVITKKYFQGYTQVEIADLLATNQVKVSRLEKGALLKLRKAMS